MDKNDEKAKYLECHCPETIIIDFWVFKNVSYNINMVLTDLENI